VLDGLAFAAKDPVVTDVWSAGRHAVKGGRHVQRDQITAAYRTAMQNLMSLL
jgi:formimidoylglutamate deiminase